MRITRLLQLALVAMVAGSTALATSMTWTVKATLSDGAIVTGYFVFDPDLGSNQIITDFNISVTGGNNTNVFFPFDFTPANSTAGGPRTANDGSFAFISIATFPDSVAGQPEPLVLDFVPVSPLTDTSSTLMNNSNMNVTDRWSGECFNCDPYVTFASAAPLTTTTTVVITPMTAAFGSLFTLTATVQDQNSNPVTNGSVGMYELRRRRGRAPPTFLERSHAAVSLKSPVEERGAQRKHSQQGGIVNALHRHRRLTSLSRYIASRSHSMRPTV